MGSVGMKIQAFFLNYAYTGEAQWNMSIMFIMDWIPRMGTLLLFSGAIEYAIAYQSDNANQKVQAIRLMVSASMLIGVTWSIRTLIYK